MLKQKRLRALDIGFVMILGLALAGCFSNPVDPVTSNGSGGGNIPVNTADNTTTSIDSSYSQADNQGIYISVRDQNGDPLGASHFTSDNFQVVYNGAQINSGSITVSTASGSGQSISSSLVLDYSGSMGAQDITDMENAAVTFVGNMQAADQGEIIKFGSTVIVEQIYTVDKSALSAAITGTSLASGMTALFDAIWQGVTDTRTQSGQRAVVAFTDGGENASVTYTSSMLTNLISDVRATGVPVYTIGLGLTPGSSSEQDLQDIANQTNGVYYYAPTSAELATIYSRIAQIFNNTLIISWPSFVYRSGDTIVITVTYSCNTGTYTSTINIVLP